MDILTEIIEVSEEIIDTLKEENFFEETPFINELGLKRELQKHMQYNWEQTNSMHLNDEQFLQIVNDLIAEGVSNGLSDLIVLILVTFVHRFYNMVVFRIVIFTEQKNLLFQSVRV
jgi:hypothetical protein